MSTWGLLQGGGLTVITCPKVIGNDVEGMMGTITNCLLKYIRRNHSGVWRERSVAYLFPIIMVIC